MEDRDLTLASTGRAYYKGTGNTGFVRKGHDRRGTL